MSFSRTNRRIQAIERILCRLETTASAVRPAFPLAADTETGIWQTEPDGRWTGGFWVGMLWLACHYNGQRSFATLAREWMQRLKPRVKINNVLNGLVFYYGAALGAIILGDREGHMLALEAARTLIRFFNPKVGIFPLGGDTTEIIDRKMVESNVDGLAGMALLHWAAETAGESLLAANAISHVRRIGEACQRSDGSLYQAASFNPESGLVERRFTPRGYSDQSTWARAQSWGMLGFVQTARHDSTLLGPARMAAAFWIRRTTDDPVAFWDFDDPGIPGVERDTSATAMAAAALLKLSSLVVDPDEAHHCRTHAEFTVDRLITSYLTPTDPKDHRPPGMLTEGCWQRKQNLATKHELVWGDYFLLEALLHLERQLTAV